MKFKVLDPVVVTVDLPDAGISKGEVGSSRSTRRVDSRSRSSTPRERRSAW
jgi:hypothetical protein